MKSITSESERAEAVTLTTSAAAKEPKAQRTLAERLCDRVLRACRRMLGTSADADDAAQLALLEILHSAHTYRGDSSLERWADRITSRTAIRYARSRRRVPLTPLESVSLSEPPPPPPMKDELARELDAYLDELSADVRETVVLRHVLDHTIEEIAELMQTSPNTVKDRLLRGRRELRALIRREQVTGAPGRGR